MKNIIAILSLAFIFSHCSNNQAQQTESIIENIDAKKFKDLSDSLNGIILDVRTPEEVSAGHIPGASAINFYDEDFTEKINFIQKDKPVFIYCRSGARSSKAAEILKNNGFKKIYNLEGGIIAWEEQGFPLVKPENTKDENIQQLTLEEFNKMILTGKPVLVDFHTKWCVPCRKMAPIVDKLAEQFKDKALILRVDIDTSKEVARHYQIKGIPVFIIFIDGKEVWKHNGIISESDLNNKLLENL